MDKFSLINSINKELYISDGNNQLITSIIMYFHMCY